jgi:hypothetical protein
VNSKEENSYVIYPHYVQKFGLITHGGRRPQHLAIWNALEAAGLALDMDSG